MKHRRRNNNINIPTQVSLQRLLGWSCFGTFLFLSLLASSLHEASAEPIQNTGRRSPNSLNQGPNGMPDAGARAQMQPGGPAMPGGDLPDPQTNAGDMEKDSNTEINVRNADITAIIRIFSKKTKRNFILDDRVKGKVSIYLPGKVSSEDAIRILDSVLGYKGFASVPVGENLWKIVPAKEAKQSTIPTRFGSAGEDVTSGMVTRLIQLKYVGADDIQKVLSQLISPDGFVSSYNGTNSLIVIDNEDNIARLLTIVNKLDVPASDQEMTIIPIVHADAKQVAETLTDILGIKGGESGGGENATTRVRAGGAASGNIGNPQFQNAGLNQPLGQPAQANGMANNGGGDALHTVGKQPKIIQDERTNSIIIVADEDTTARARALISQLDSKLDLSGVRYYVYHCQHAKAEDLAEVIGGLTGEGGSSGSSKSSSNSKFNSDSDLISGSGSGSGFGSSGRNTSNSRTQDRLASQRRTPGRSRNDGNQNSGAKSVQLGDNLSISADASTNSLIIFASKTDYEKIRSLLEKLDIKREQVLVEAMLLEVSVNEDKTMSTSFITSTGGKDGGIIAQNNGNNIIGLLSNPASIQDFSVAVASAGTLTLGGGSSQTTIPTQSVLLNAAQTNSNVNVLSAPTILTTDNEEAEIVVGENVPFLTGTGTNSTNLDNQFNSIDRQDVGITLRLTPQISSSESVTMKIFTEVSNVSSNDPRLGPTTAIRTSETSVITRDGQMVVIGGLMSDGFTDTVSGIPYLMDIPVLGHLFRSSTENRQRKNLLILITPRVIKDQFDHRDATKNRTREMGNSISEMESYPSRESILNSLEIDQVAEPHPMAPGSTDVGTIKAPAADAGVSDTPSSTDSMSSDSAPVPQEKKRLEFEVRPKTEAKFSAPEATVAKTTASGEYYVFQADTVNKNAPFSITGSQKLVTVKIPDDAKNVKLLVGQKYNYLLGNSNKVTLTLLGRFPSANDARILYGDVSNWYELSAHEILNFGKGPWQIASKQ